MVRAATLLALVGAAAAAPAYPTPPAFSADVVEHPFTSPVLKVTNDHPHFDRGSVRTDFGSLSLDWNLTYSVYSWLGPDFANLKMQQVCIADSCTNKDRAIGLHFLSPYVATLFELWQRIVAGEGSYDGPQEIDGQEFNCWKIFEVDTVGAPEWMRICADEDGVPRRLEVEPNGNKVGWSNVLEFAHNLTFHNITVGDLGPFTMPHVWVDDVPQDPDQQISCSIPKLGSELQVLRAFRDPEPMGIMEDRDFFDWQGLGITLGYPGYMKFGSAQYLEMFDVEIVNEFELWRDCNYQADKKQNVCTPPLASNGTLVTRASAEMMQGEKYLGLCEDNDKVGNWYTFPHEGKCGDAALGTNGCTWRMKAVKVIDMQCMINFNGGWQAAWDQDLGHAPFPHVVAHAQAAMEACPDVREAMVTV